MTENHFEKCDEGCAEIGDKVGPITGFPEYLPREQILFENFKASIAETFARYGFSPLETPAVERLSTLLAKGADHEIYELHRVGGADTGLGLRFDLTVPLARYVAQHYGNLVFPFRRYHIAPVWRGERPQAGRYRQFYQCDIDIIGDGALSPLYDAEVAAIAIEILGMFPLGPFVMKINNRKVMLPWLEEAGVIDLAAALKLIDKKEKVPLDDIINGLVVLGFSRKREEIEEILSPDKTTDEWLAFFRNNIRSTEGIDELESLVITLRALGVPEVHFRIDPSLVRGLDYYTGTVFEAVFIEYPDIGSVSGGGRYANLATMLSGRALPGVGLTIGISRLFPKLLARGLAEGKPDTPARVLVTSQDRNAFSAYCKIAQRIRGSGINAELYLEDKSLKAQLNYARRKGFSVAIIANATELSEGVVVVRSLSDSVQKTVPQEALIRTVSEMLP